jgi:hypothetical protein
MLPATTYDRIWSYITGSPVIKGDSPTAVDRSADTIIMIVFVMLGIWCVFMIACWIESLMVFILYKCRSPHPVVHQEGDVCRIYKNTQDHPHMQTRRLCRCRTGIVVNVSAEWLEYFAFFTCVAFFAIAILWFFGNPGKLLEMFPLLNKNVKIIFGRTCTGRCDTLPPFLLPSHIRRHFWLLHFLGFH